jgi:hypothetical protein
VQAQERSEELVCCARPGQFDGHYLTLAPQRGGGVSVHRRRAKALDAEAMAAAYGN